jgi:hypothetical protein
MAVILACTLVFAAGAGLIAAGEPQDYRARAYVIQVPSDLGGQRGIELARSQPVLDRAIELSGVAGVDSRALRRDSKAEITSRLDLAFTVEAARAEDAAELAAGYARAFREAIPDDSGLPVRGVRAGAPERELGPWGWAVLGGCVGFGLGAALTLLRNGLRSTRGRGTAHQAG